MKIRGNGENRPKGGEKRLCPVYALFAPQSGKSPGWLKIKMCVILLPFERVASQATDTDRRPAETGELTTPREASFDGEAPRGDANPHVSSSVVTLNHLAKSLHRIRDRMRPPRDMTPFAASFLSAFPSLFRSRRYVPRVMHICLAY